MKSVNLQANAPLTGVKYKVERHDRGASAPNAADLAAVEHAKQAATRQAQRSQLERFNHELELRVERSERAKREEEKKLAAIRVAKARTDLAAANERARAPFKLEVAAAAAPAWPASQEHGTQLSLQRQILQDAGQRAIQMMMQLYQPDEEQPDEAAARYIAVSQLASPEQGAPEKAASERGTVRVLQAAADRAVAHDRRIQLEEYAVHKKRATQEARKAAAWHLAHTSARLEEARGQAEAQQAERTASMSHELAVERSELQQAEQAKQTERYIEALRQQLKHEVALRPRPLPPLCACGLDPLDNHVQRCARNCLFHKNPAAYSRALSGLISRTVKLQAPPTVA